MKEGFGQCHFPFRCKVRSFGISSYSGVPLVTTHLYTTLPRFRSCLGLFRDNSGGTKGIRAFFTRNFEDTLNAEDCIRNTLITRSRGFWSRQDRGCSCKRPREARCKDSAIEAPLLSCQTRRTLWTIAPASSADETLNPQPTL